MAVILRSDAIAPGDRVEFIREAIWQGVLPVEIDWQQSPEELELICRIAVAGPLNFSSARSATNGIRRTSRLAGVDHDPRIFVAIQVSGTTRIEQAGHQSELARGDMVVYDSTKPYSIVNVDRTELHYFQIPRSTFAVPDRILDQVLGVRFGPDNYSLAGLVAPYFASLGSGDVLDQPGAAELVAEPSIQLLRALVTHQVADREASTGTVTSGPPRSRVPTTSRCATCTPPWPGPASDCGTPSSSSVWNGAAPISATHGWPTWRWRRSAPGGASSIPPTSGGCSGPPTG